MKSLLRKQQWSIIIQAIQECRGGDFIEQFQERKAKYFHGFKEELKIKYDAVLAVVGKFMNGTGPMLELLKVETVPLDWTHYCVMSVAD